MNTYSLIFQIDDDFKGNVKEVAERLGVTNKTIYQAVKKPYKVKGHTIKEIAIQKKIYQVFRDDELVMEDTLENIANKLYIQKSSIYNAYKQNRKMLKEYTIRRADDC